MDFEEAAGELTSRGSDRKKPSLEKTKEALEKLGNPEEDCKVLLVGGTNGKGSTTRMISRLLEKQGFRVGSYTSPHLVTLRERVELDGEKISEEAFMELYQEIEELDLELTFFEFMTVAAYLHFSKKDVDYAIMEVGMGGRLDATNAASHETAVITNVERDHTQYLGETREEIAKEKAAIIPGSGKVVLGEKLGVFVEEAKDKDADIVEVNRNGLDLSIPGFQQENFEIASKVVCELEEIPDDAEEIVENMAFPGRMEKVSEDPEVVLDGAHNVAALEKVIDDFPEDFVCVFNCLESKDVERMVSILEEKASKFYITESGFFRSGDPESIAEEVSTGCEVVEDPVEALEAAKREGKPVVVTGSLYLIGDLKGA